MTAQDEGRRRGTGRNLHLARLLVLIGAVGIVVLALCGGGLSGVVGLLAGSPYRLLPLTFSLSLLALGVGLGGALAWQAWQALQGRPSRSLWPRRIGLLVILLLAAVAAGIAVLTLDVRPVYLFPPLHVLAAVLPSLILVALTVRAVRVKPLWRDMVLQLSSGAFLSTGLAMVLEGVMLLALLIVLLVAVAVQPGGAEQIQEWALRIQDPAFLNDTSSLVQLARTPAVVIGLLLVMAGFVPLLEEAVKGLGVALLGYRRPSRPMAFVWGLTCGAGFALTEGLFNTLGGLSAWAPLIMMRTGTTLLHGLTGGLLGLAWQALLVERRRVRPILLYGGSVAIHALWNGLVAGISVVALSRSGAAEEWPVTGILTALLLVLALVVCAVLVALARWLRRQESTSSELALRGAELEDPPGSVQGAGEI